MFTSRVLPRPVPFTEKHPHAASSNTVAGSEVVYPVPSPAAPGVNLPVPSASTRPDALTEHRIIMPGDREKDAVHVLSSAASPAQRSRLRSISPRRESRLAENRPSPESIDDKQSVDTEVSTASAVPATSTSTRKKRRLNQANEPSTTSKTPAVIAVAPTQQRERHASVADSPSQICLCQPDPKVPRPRNAFILYRQHHQAKVVNENPGLANPEISKIIGDQWRSSPAEVKAHWKSLAEEEKLRHQRQYPDYRYQPRRGRNSIAAAATTQPGQASPRCPKCGGKSMATPTHLPSPGFRPSTVPPPESPVNHSHPHAQAYVQAANTHGYSQHAPHTPYPSQAAMMNQPPRTPYGIPGPYIGMSPIHPNFSHAQRAMYPGARPQDPSEHPLSPDAKRRRYDSGPGSYAPSSSQHQRHLSRPLPPQLHQSSHQHHNSLSGNERLPRPDFMQPKQQSPGFTIAPAPPGSNRTASTNPNGSSRPDSSLTLAPLKIATPNTPQATTSQASITAMLLSIRPLTKLLTLSRISPPLSISGPTSPPHAIRGALISIEYGEDRPAGESIANAIRDELVRANECITRAFEPPRMDVWDRDGGPRMADVLRLMDAWHGVSEEVRKWITRVPEPSDNLRPGGFANAGRGTRSVSPTSPHTTTRPTLKRKAPDPSSTDPPTAADTKAPLDPITALTLAASPPDPPLPIAFIPNYQLTATDVAACAVPIADEYSPTDHWRWCAALWRGTLGPDVVVVIRGPEESDGVLSPEGERMGAGGKKGPVEVRLEDARTVVVRLERRGEVGEGVLRRVAFEVGEWVRGRGGRG